MSFGPKCLVVGGAGFVGRALVRRLLAEGYEVRVFDLVAPALSDPRVEVQVGDLRDAAAVDRAASGVQTIFHTAAMISLIGVARSRTRERVMDVNVGGTRRLLEASRRHGVQQFVFTSSNNVCFDRPVLDGDEQCAYARRCVDLYTQSKIACERLVLPADGQGGLRTCALRPGGIWGPGPGGYMVERFLEQLARGRLLATIGSGAAVADNTHVENLVDALLLAARGLAERPEVVGGQAYFITDDEPMNPVEWFRPLCDALGLPLPARKVPGTLMYALGYASECLSFAFGVPALLTRIEVLKVTRSHSFRIDKARRDLGYEPAITLRGGGIDACVPFARELVARVQAATATV